MKLRKNCPCDVDGICPYEAERFSSCEYWCGDDESEYYWNEDEIEALENHGIEVWYY